MTRKRLFTPRQVIEARAKIINLSVDQLLAEDYIDIAAVLGDTTPPRITYEVILLANNDRKIQVIKEIRAATNLGLGEAKALSDTLPNIVLRTERSSEASSFADRLRLAGATVEVNLREAAA